MKSRSNHQSLAWLLALASAGLTSLAAAEPRELPIPPASDILAKLHKGHPRLLAERDDFGLPQIPGFAEAGTFPVYVTGPLGRTFNYADGGDAAIRAPHMFWFAREFKRPA